MVVRHIQYLTRPPRQAARAIDINQPGRVRVNDMLTILRVSRTTLYRGISKGRYPAPDGHDGTLPYWSTETVRRFLKGDAA